jgi:predicted ATPase
MVAVLAGAWDLASDFVTLLEERTARGAMDVWNVCAKAYDAAMLLQKGRLSEGIDQLAEATARLERGGFFLHSSPLRLMLAVGLFRNGRISDALEVIETELGRCRASGEGWIMPELWRVRTELATVASAIAPAEAEIELKRALDLAHEQGAYEWEIRISNTLGIALASVGKSFEAAQLLEGISRRAHVNHRSASLDRLRDLRDRIAVGSTINDGAFTTLY